MLWLTLQTLRQISVLVDLQQVVLPEQSQAVEVVGLVVEDSVALAAVALVALAAVDLAS
jgi:hypothetical protein